MPTVPRLPTHVAVGVRGAAADHARERLSALLRIPLSSPSSPGAARLLALAAEDIGGTGIRLNDTASRYSPNLWRLWAGSDRPVGGGLAACAGELVALHDDLLFQGAVEFLTWLASPVDRDHPLVARSHNQPGRRAKHRPLARSGVDYHARAYLGWRKAIGRPSPWSARELLAMADLSAASAPHRRRVELTIEILESCLDVLDKDEVTVIVDPVRRRAWHAREKAALLARLWGVLRASELVRLTDDLTVTEWGLRTTLFQTKSNTTRFVRFPVRGDRFCPVKALGEWLEASLEAGYDRGGRLLPVVLRRREAGSVISTGVATERNNAQLIFQAIGLAEEIGEDDILSLHNLRSVLPTIAADRGHDLTFLQALGAWARRTQPGDAYVSTRDGLDEATVADAFGGAA